MTKRGEYLAIHTIHESTTNPRRTFDEVKLYELAGSINANGPIQPITVRLNKKGESRHRRTALPHFDFR